MARYRRERKLYQLNFEDDELAGFECVMSGVSLERFIEITQLASALETPEGRTPENIERQFTAMAEQLVSWNLDDDDDQPVPASYEGLKAQDFTFVQAIMQGYMQALSSVPKASSEARPLAGLPRSGHSGWRAVERPGELAEAELVLALCDRFRSCRSQVLGEDAGMLRLLKIESLGTAGGRRGSVTKA